jgi:hypothetical protein
MRVRPATAPRSIQRERVEDRPGAGVPVELVEAAQHPLAVRADRGGVALTRRGQRGAASELVLGAPVRPGWLAGHQQPATESPAPRCGWRAPSPPRRPTGTGTSAAGPAQQVQPVGAQRGRGPAGCLQVVGPVRDCFHRRPGRVEELVGLPHILGDHQPAGLRHDHGGQVSGMPLFVVHDGDVYHILDMGAELGLRLS